MIEYNKFETDTMSASGTLWVIKAQLYGRRTKVTNPEGAETEYEYDLNGNVLKITDALGNETTFTYDVMNRVATTTDARGAVTSYTYTATGLTATVTDAQNVVNKYKADEKLINTKGYEGAVNREMWQKLGLPFNKTLEEEFFGNSITLPEEKDTIQFTIKGNNITIDYFPKFYITGSSRDVKYYTEEIILGIRNHWEKNDVDIQGVKANFRVNIRSDVVYDKKYANVFLNVKAGENNGHVLGATIWDNREQSRLEMTLNHEADASMISSKTPDIALRNLAAHEFAHVLGVFDAYQYILAPGTPPDYSLLSDKDIMRGNLEDGMVIGDVVYEMVLYAWSHNKLQTFGNTVFGETSQALYH